jgi:hypothetical protein
MLIAEMDLCRRPKADRQARFLRSILQIIGRRCLCPLVTRLFSETMYTAERKPVPYVVLCETFAHPLVNNRLTRALDDLLYESSCRASHYGLFQTSFALWCSSSDFYPWWPLLHCSGRFRTSRTQHHLIPLKKYHLHHVAATMAICFLVSISAG